MLDSTRPHEIEHFAAQGPCVLVEVGEAKGSTPRIAGTMMLVSNQAVLGTIGGGQLEYMAIDAARDMLKTRQATRSLAIPLGPEIGQCCGGHVSLKLEMLTAEKVGALAQAAGAALAAQPHIYLFGAGHVGRALASALLPLPVNLLLVDTRADELSLADPAIPRDLTALPEAHIRSAPAGSAFVILTHDHALDFLLAREALERAMKAGDVAYTGMIGSKTKRATFARWLNAETGSRDSLTHLTMPIGASRLSDKRPAVIAAMVAAEVMETVGTFHHTSEFA